ncbi:MAG: dephospho-CoA kinase [Steroidobacterales bacterium]
MGHGPTPRPRFRVGLTGGIAAGKSTVAHRFAELGVPVIDADEAARAVVVPGRPALGEVVQRFGAGILAPNGELDRRALRRLVFADPAARRDLEAILHPAIWAEMESLASQAHGAYLIMSIPLLVEAGNARNRVDRILVIDADETAQVARLQARDGCTETEGRAIIAAQASRAERLRVADDVLQNVADLAQLRGGVDRLHERYLALAAAMAE